MRKPPIQIIPAPDTTLAHNNLPVRIPDDRFGGRGRVQMHHWRSPLVMWSQTVGLMCPQTQKPFTFVDVGANVGFFSRQMISMFKQLCQVYAYEPEPSNYEDARFNLQPWIANHRVFLEQVGLGKEARTVDLYRDSNNCGNFSQLQIAMQEWKAPYDSTPIKIVPASERAYGWLGRGLPILYKSDTQGMDEEIATLIPIDVWDTVFAAILELWRIPKAELALNQKDKLAYVLNRFTYKMFLAERRHVTTQDVLSWITHKPDFKSTDLVMWR